MPIVDEPPKLIRAKLIANSGGICSRCGIVGDIIEVRLVPSNSSYNLYRSYVRRNCCIIRGTDLELLDDNTTSTSGVNFALIAMGV